MVSYRTGDEFTPRYRISEAAELVAMHPQTLRQYDRLGLVVPRRVGTTYRKYSLHDIARLRQVRTLAEEGVSLAGIRRILDLEEELLGLQDRIAGLQQRVRQLNVAARAVLRQQDGTGRQANQQGAAAARVFVADHSGAVTAFAAASRRRGVAPLPLPPGRSAAMLAITSTAESSSVETHHPKTKSRNNPKNQ